MFKKEKDFVSITWKHSFIFCFIHFFDSNVLLVYSLGQESWVCLMPIAYHN